MVSKNTVTRVLEYSNPSFLIKHIGAGEEVFILKETCYAASY